MVYPGDVFTYIVGINLQTMLHHGSQLLVGALLAVWLRRRLSLRFFALGCVAFLSVSLIALGLNVVAYHILQAMGRGDTFNMFFISPYFPCTLPLLSSLQPQLPYPIFLSLYVVCFTMIAALLHGVTYAVWRLLGSGRGGDKRVAQ